MLKGDLETILGVAQYIASSMDLFYNFSQKNLIETHPLDVVFILSQMFIMPCQSSAVLHSSVAFSVKILIISAWKDCKNINQSRLQIER